MPASGRDTIRRKFGDAAHGAYAIGIYCFNCNIAYKWLHNNGEGWGGGYGHDFKLMIKQDLVWWVGMPIRHGARDGSASSLHRHWLLEDANYDDVIASNMMLMGWCQIKGVFKLNNNLASPGRGKEGYNPAAKYNLIFQTIWYNMNYFTLWAELDVAGNEST